MVSKDIPPSSIDPTIHRKQNIKKKIHNIRNSTPPKKREPNSCHTQGEENERDVLALDNGKLKSRRWCDLHVSCRGVLLGVWPGGDDKKTVDHQHLNVSLSA